MASPQAFGLDPSVIEQIAEELTEAIVTRVVARLREDDVSRRATAWLDAQEVARRLSVSREWVYEHADELGASRIGSGPRPRLRFPPQILDSRRRGQASAATAGEAAPRKPKLTGLIPIHHS
jgi:hypothetical protein